MPYAASFRHPTSSHLILSACIDTAIPYLDHASTQEPDSLVKDTCKAIVATIDAILPPVEPQPAQPRPDDRERVMSQWVLTDEEPMQALLSSLDEPDRRVLVEAADRERAHLPLFPIHVAEVLPNWARSDDLFDPGEQPALFGQLDSFRSRTGSDRKCNAEKSEC